MKISLFWENIQYAWNFDSQRKKGEMNFTNKIQHLFFVNKYTAQEV